MYKGKEHELARKRITELATQAKEVIKNKKKAEVKDLIATLAIELAPKFARLFAKLENRMMYSPIDTIYLKIV